jgi:hypothetical protein
MVVEVEEEEPQNHLDLPILKIARKILSNFLILKKIKLPNSKRIVLRYFILNKFFNYKFKWEYSF